MYIYIKFKIIYNVFGDDMDLKKLTLKEKVGQKFMFGVNSHNIDIIIKLIKDYHIGGVILYKKNYNNYDEMLSVIKSLKEANSNNKIPLFIAIDQEGGRVNRMPSEFKNIKNIYDMSYNNADLIYASANITGKMLAEMGINMNFAPVLDIYDKKGGKILYKRCFYGDIDDVSVFGMKYVQGLKDNGLISVIKHFPGHGVSKMDSHFITPYVYNYNKVLDKHLKPFEYAITNGIDAVMVNHLVIRGMTGGLPASISSYFIDEYLRNKNKFQGLVITDEINMLSRNIFYKFGYMKKALTSGSDIILVKVKENYNINVLDKFIKCVESNKDYIRLLDDSVKRIMKIKDKYNVNDDISYGGCNVVDINKRIDKINSVLNK